jgi:hypothetical protein
MMFPKATTWEMNYKKLQIVLIKRRCLRIYANRKINTGSPMVQDGKSVPFVVFGSKGYGNSTLSLKFPVRMSPCRYHLRPRPHPLPFSVFVTLLNTTSSVPAEDLQLLWARFRIFPNNDLRILGVREIGYNRAHRRLRCTRISLGF